jgi:DNA-binding NarL/FixJ family response regulator
MQSSGDSTTSDAAEERADSLAGPSHRPLTVLVADDHVLVRDGFKLLVSGILKSATIVEAGDGDSLLRAIRAHSPSSLAPLSLALVDLNMPGMERGVRLAEIARANPRLPLVVISALTSPDIVRRTLAIETVCAFVPKSATSEHIRLAIDAALQGKKLPFATTLVKSTASEFLLTPRLEEVRQLLRQGMSNKMIAITLGITEGTVKNHMSEIFKALNVSNRTQAAQLDADRF